MRRLALCLALAACQPLPAPQKAPRDAGAARRLAALGDSFTIGTGSPEEASFPARLAHRWRAALALPDLSGPFRPTLAHRCFPARVEPGEAPPSG